MLSISVQVFSSSFFKHVEEALLDSVSMIHDLNLYPSRAVFQKNGSFLTIILIDLQLKVEASHRSWESHQPSDKDRERVSHLVAH